jgi:hypothetical protein
MGAARGGDSPGVVLGQFALISCDGSGACSGAL